MKYLEATRNGFLLLELTSDRAVGTWMYVGDVSLPSDATLDEGPSFMTRAGDNRLQRNSMR